MRSRFPRNYKKVFFSKERIRHYFCSILYLHCLIFELLWPWLDNRREMDDEEPLVKKEPPKWRNTKIGLFQFWSGAILTVISYLQVHALINSLALKWTFPEDYTKKGHFYCSSILMCGNLQRLGSKFWTRSLAQIWYLTQK